MNQRGLFVCLLLVSIGGSSARISGAELAGKESKRNVLFIAVDDLTCTLGCYGDRLAKTPAIDALASRGVVFRNAYCQLPLCNPSRASVMTGRRPDEIKVYDLDRHFREQMPQAVTLPQLFKEAGWRSARVGKLYHYNVPAGIGTDGLDDPPSWDQVVNPKGRDTAEEHLITNAEPHRPVSAALSWLAAEGSDEEQTDGMIATEAIRLLESFGDEPFFLGVGFFRPHTPYVAPKKYFDLYPRDLMAMPFAPEGDRADIPAAAFAHNCPIPNYGLPVDLCLDAKQAYYASVSFVDAQVARLVAALERLNLADNTVVVLWSDHGYHLGEHAGTWQKRCLFEESAKSPLIVFDPAAKGNGKACKRVVEFVDIYPTVAELSGLEPDTGLTGQSLVPLLDSPARPWDSAAITQVVRPGNGRPIMGRSVRTERWRYTEWNGAIDGVELYDHQADPGEFKNLALDATMRVVREKLSRHFDGKASAMPPKSSINPKRL
ncbi:MAG: sulfatase [Aureliella sp.]